MAVHCSLPQEKESVGCLLVVVVILCLDPLMDGGVGRDYRAAVEVQSPAVLGCGALLSRSLGSEPSWV